MKKVNLIKTLLYKVEMGTETTNLTDWIGDYIPATSAFEALELAKAWLIENGYTGNINNLIFHISVLQTVNGIKELKEVRRNAYAGFYFI